MNNFLFYLIIASIFITTLESVALPKEFIPCHRSDPKILECLTINTKRAVRSIRNGYPPLKIDTMEPFKINEATIGRGNGPVDIAQNYKNVEVYGITYSKEFNIKKINFDDFEIAYTVVNPTVRWQVDYHLTGKVLLLNVNGKGKANITLTNLYSLSTIKGKYYMKKGKKYLNVTDYTAENIKADLVQYNFENLFNGNKELSENINSVLNDQWQAIYNDVKQEYGNILCEVFKYYANLVFNNIPFDDLFLQ